MYVQLHHVADSSFLALLFWHFQHKTKTVFHFSSIVTIWDSNLLISMFLHHIMGELLNDLSPAFEVILKARHRLNSNPQSFSSLILFVVNWHMCMFNHPMWPIHHFQLFCFGTKLSFSIKTKTVFHFSSKVTIWDSNLSISMFLHHNGRTLNDLSPAFEVILSAWHRLDSNLQSFSLLVSSIVN